MFEKSSVLLPLLVAVLLSLMSCERTKEEVVEVYPSTASEEQIGDDTYVPDFDVSQLSFSEVWVPDTMESGLETQIRFKMENRSADPATRIQVGVELYEVSSGTVEEAQQDIQSGTYRSGELLIYSELGDLDGLEQKEVVLDIRVPETLQSGVYAGVFVVTYEETVTESASSVSVAPATVIVGQPDLPNLRVLSANLTAHSLELPQVIPDDAPDLPKPAGNPALSLFLEVESMAHPTESEVDLTFALEIPNGDTFPLAFVNRLDNGSLALTRTDVFETSCHYYNEQGQRLSEETALRYGLSYPPPAGEAGVTCASLFRQDQVGRQYRFYLTSEIAAALKQLSLSNCQRTTTGDACLVDLVVALDPEGAIEEWRDNKADNLKRLPLAFLPPESSPSARTAAADDCGAPRNSGPYCKSLQPVTIDEYDSWGNRKWGAFEYQLQSDTNYQAMDLTVLNKPLGIPYAFYTNQLAKASGFILGQEDPLVHASFQSDFNLKDEQSILNSYMNYKVLKYSEQQGAKVYFEYSQTGVPDYLLTRLGFPADADLSRYTLSQLEELVSQDLSLWSTFDEEVGEERFTYFVETLYEGTVIVQAVAVTFRVGLDGFAGFWGVISANAGQGSVAGVAGFEAKLNGYLQGGVGVQYEVAKLALQLEGDIKLTHLRVGVSRSLQLQLQDNATTFSAKTQVPFYMGEDFDINLKVTASAQVDVEVPVAKSSWECTKRTYCPFKKCYEVPVCGYKISFQNETQKLGFNLSSSYLAATALIFSASLFASLFGAFLLLNPFLIFMPLFAPVFAAGAMGMGAMAKNLFEVGLEDLGPLTLFASEIRIDLSTEPRLVFQLYDLIPVVLNL